MFLINGIALSPNPVGVKEKFKISVEIIMWDRLEARYTWDSLKRSGETWESLRSKATDMDFSSTWDSARETYTWNSLKRYPSTWDELKGGQS